MLALLRRLLPLIGLLLIALFIWFAGAYFAFAEYRPLESANARLIAIALVVTIWGVSKLLKRMRAGRTSDKLVAAVVQQAHKETPRPSADVVQLRERFEDAVAALKQKRRSGHTLYELPWYVIIGAPGSGKTTALVNSGLHFPLEQRTGRGALRGVGGTRNCDWWFTDEAVLLDTAGRYTTQDSDASADSAGWKEFLALLRKYRRRRPVNGVILTISVHDLMQGHATTEAHVDAARRRLNELNEELHIQLPVYLMVTKCDLVAGFTEYFDDLVQEGRAQVWGVTFPYDQTLKGSAAAAFPAEFDALVTRLNERVLDRVEEDRDARRRTRIFGFPQQIASLRDALGNFITEVFTSTRFDRQVLLRGVYFTSGTQEGTPIDRLAGAIGRRFGVAADAMMPPPGRGKAYFIERLIKEVLLGESGLAGVNRRFEVQKAAAELGAYAAMAVAAALGVIIWTVSYNRNRAYVDAVSTDVARLGEVPPVTAASLDAALPRLDRIRQVVDSADRYPDGGPWSMRWGLYQGSSLSNAARDAYSRELDGVMLSTVADRFRQRLIQYAAEPETLYDYLKGYLMLGQPEHLDKKQLEYLASFEWESAYAADPDRAASVARHFRSLLEYNDSLRPVVLDNTIVEQARSTLRLASPAGLVYRYAASHYASDTARALRLDVAAGLTAERVLRRKSRISLTEPVPSLYTKPVFEEITGQGGTDAIVKQFVDEYWVWGDTRPAVLGTARLTAEFQDIYEKKYIEVWDRILNDIQLTPLSSLEVTKEALATLSGPTSPLRGLLKVIDDNTFLVKPSEPPKPGIVGRVGEAIRKGKETLGVPTAVPGAQVTAHFAEIHRLLAGDKGAAQIDTILEKVRQLQQTMQPVGSQIGGTNPGDARAIASVGDSADQLRREAAPLPPSISAVVTEVANGAARAVRGEARGTLERQYQMDVVRECRDIISDKYPFFPGSPTDVPLADFGRLFGYGGVYESFFKAELVDLVDTTGRQWVWRSDTSGAAVSGSTGILRQFEAAEQIRGMFFRPGSQVPQVELTLLEPESLDGNLEGSIRAQRFVLELDGQILEYRHQALLPKSVAWPGPKPGVAGVTFWEPAGGRPNRTFPGPWAWFRLLDASQAQRQSDVRYLITFERDGHSARVPIEAASVRNPFGKQTLQQFRCE
jgi:type VI secretion system protein ImpL